MVSGLVNLLTCFLEYLLNHHKEMNIFIISQCIFFCITTILLVQLHISFSQNEIKNGNSSYARIEIIHIHFQ